jgi:hypothetical protein
MMLPPTRFTEMISQAGGYRRQVCSPFGIVNHRWSRLRLMIEPALVDVRRRG